MGKEAIIDHIKAGKPENEFVLNRRYLSFDKCEDLHKVFKINAENVGCNVIEINSEGQLNPFISTNYKEACYFGNKKYSGKDYKDKPLNKLGQVACVVIHGKFGVAENGAIWLDNTNFPANYIPFIAEKLVVILDKKDIVSDMHEAYSRIGSSEFGFGVFISGPSKTADIEQSLVYGAQGAVEMDVILTNLN